MFSEMERALGERGGRPGSGRVSDREESSGPPGARELVFFIGAGLALVLDSGFVVESASVAVEGEDVKVQVRVEENEAGVVPLRAVEGSSTTRLAGVWRMSCRLKRPSQRWQIESRCKLVASIEAKKGLRWTRRSPSWERFLGFLSISTRSLALDSDPIQATRMGLSLR